MELRDGPYCTGLLYLNPKTKRFPTLVWSFFLSIKGIFGVVLVLNIGPLFVFLPFPSGLVPFFLLNLLIYLFYSIACALLVARPTRLFQALLSCRPLCFVRCEEIVTASPVMVSRAFFFFFFSLATVSQLA